MRIVETISLEEHEREVSRLSLTIDRLNAELSALAAYLIVARPVQAGIETERAATLAAKVGRMPQHVAADNIQRIHEAVTLSGGQLA